MRIGFVFSYAALTIVLCGSAATPEDNSFLIRNVTVHPVVGADVINGSVLVEDGKVSQVGVRIAKPAGVRVIEGGGLQLYPGLINAATNVGLDEIQSVRDTVDLDELGMFNPELRAEVAFNPSSEHIPVTRASGITSVIILPGSGGRGPRGNLRIITGQGALMHLDGWTWEDMAVKRSALMDLLFPEIQTRPGRPFADAEREYQDRLAQISELFEQARRYQKAKLADPSRFEADVRLEALLPVLDRSVPIFMRAEREQMIKDAVAFADKEKIRIIIADPREIGSAGPVLKEHQIPVVLGKTFQLPMRDDDPYDAPYTLPNEVFRAGIKFCFGTFDTEFARNVPFEAAQAAAFGLPRPEALKALTIYTAQIFGVEDRLGSIEKGKLADFILTDGDPLEEKTRIERMFIAGREVSLESRQSREYEKWMKRP